MSLTYSYPAYEIDLTDQMLTECCDIGVRLLHELGIAVENARFLDAIRGKEGVRVIGDRVCLDERLVRRNIDRFIAKERERALKLEGRAVAGRRREDGGELLPPAEGRPSAATGVPAGIGSGGAEWRMRGGGFSMAVIDVGSEEVRPATCQDLRDLIALVRSYGIEGDYPVIPQDVPPIMQSIAVFKVAWESSDRIRCLDYTDRRQTRYLYELHNVMEKPFTLFLTVHSPMTISGGDLGVFLDFYPDWKRRRDIEFMILDYPMLGISKPITLTGSIAQYIAEEFGIYTLLNLFDPELEVPIGIPGGLPTDMRNACWAWGHPRQHLFAFLNSRILPRLCGIEVGRYERGETLLETASCALDGQASLEKMGVGMVAALQGARSFSGLGSLCVDDLFSGVQFVIDVEIVNYIREAVESFSPHGDIVSMNDLYETLLDVCSGGDSFLSSPDTAGRFRHIVPSSDLLRREKLRSWLGHGQIMKDRAREECVSRIKGGPEYHLPAEKQKALDGIYARAERELLGGRSG